MALLRRTGGTLSASLVSGAMEAGTTPPQGPRDANEWYLGIDPLSIVDTSLLDLVHERGGRELLDLGCGLGGSAPLLAQRGHAVKALDVNPEYVRVARELGVDADTFDGSTIPLP